MTNSSQVLALAKREIGYKEHPSGSNGSKFGRWYGMDYQPWCAMFVSYCFYNAGLPLPITKSLGFAYCPYGVHWFKQRGQLLQTPEVGDVVFFDWTSDGVADHVGIVESIRPDGSIVAIEGNTSTSDNSNGGQVMQRVRSRRLICGFGRPGYVENNDDRQIIVDYPLWQGRYITLTSPFMRGKDVLTWQAQMINRGIYLGSSGQSRKGDDGVFGEISYKALLNFQEENGLKRDGFLGPISWEKAWTIPIK